jgi:copper resistance protein C
MVMCTRSAAAVILTLLMLLVAGPAFAHVELRSATPAQGVTVTETLSEVRLEFTGELQAGGDHAVGLFDPSGERVDVGGPVEASDRVLTAAVGPLERSGEYTVRWMIIAADGHTQEDAYTFTFDGPLAAPIETGDEGPAEGGAAGRESPAAEPAPAEAPVDDAGESAAVENVGGLPLVAVVGLVAVVFLGVGLLLARVRSGARDGGD